MLTLLFSGYQLSLREIQSSTCRVKRLISQDNFCNCNQKNLGSAVWNGGTFMPDSLHKGIDRIGFELQTSAGEANAQPLSHGDVVMRSAREQWKIWEMWNLQVGLLTLWVLNYFDKTCNYNSVMRLARSVLWGLNNNRRQSNKRQ